MRFIPSLNLFIRNRRNNATFSNPLSQNSNLKLGLGFQFGGDCRNLSTNCRAVLMAGFGGPEVLEFRDDVAVPDLQPEEVLVRSRAVSVNPLDLRMRAGYGRSLFEPHLPLILGRDVSGEIAAVGSAVRSLTVGQEVFGALHPTAIRGTCTDYAILSEEEVTTKPAALSHTVSLEDNRQFSPKSDACAIPFPALTAWRALKSTARISSGQNVLVIGGGGAVGFSAIQLAVASGCHVTTTVGGDSVERVLAVGAEKAVDYITEDCEAAITDQFDAVLDTIGVPQTEKLGIGVLKRGGHYMTLQGEAASLSDKYGLAVGLPMSTSLLLKKQIQYRCSHGIEYWWTYMRADYEGLLEISRLAELGKLKVPVAKTFPIVQVREAHEAKDKRAIPGKIVLEID